MRKISILLILCFVFSFGQSRKGQFQLQQSSKSHTLYVCFSPTIDANDAINKVLSKNLAFKTFARANRLSFTNDLGLSDGKLNEMVENSKKNKKTGQSIEKLKRIYKIHIPTQSNESIVKLAEAFEKFPEVEYASIVSNEPITPPFIYNTTTVTPNLEEYQNYLLDNPGINANYAWSRGITGNNVRVRDIEYGLHKSHEMLVDREAIQLEPGFSPSPWLTDPAGQYYNFMDHGTAVMSIMGAAKNNIGISGTAYNANEYIGFMEWTKEESYNRVSAVARAINASRAGDIILYEMQTGGKNSNYVPAEYNNLVWDLTKAATDAGIIIIAAAGNGNENLDDPFYAAYHARGNSGAIIVGAGTSDTEHSKLWFSTYGSRVDIQGWGHNVLAAGYGGWAKYDNDSNRTYTMFAGTSSATPVVASAAILIQSYHFQSTGRYLKPLEMKNLLVNTGIPQGGNLSTKIGPLPNIKAAIEYLEIIDPKTPLIPLKIELYPNPASDYLCILTKNIDNKNIDIEIINTHGQIVLKDNTNLVEKKLNISHLPKGIYLIHATDGNRRVIEKLIKQ